MDRCELFALVAAREAWADAGSPEVDPYRLGVVVASGIGGIGSTLAALRHAQRARAGSGSRPFTVPMLMPNGAAGWISIEFGAKAGAHAPVSACASGAEAIGYGIDMIRSGRADVVRRRRHRGRDHGLNIGAFAAMRALSTRNDEPERASRPFDQRRDGFVLGEGAGVLVLESREHAAGARRPRLRRRRRRRATPPTRTTSRQPDPDGAGAVLAIRRALENAQVSAAQVTHVNAHATSTPAGDVVEAHAIAEALGDAASSVVVSATKSMTGHLLGGAGAVESVAAIMALHDKTAPPTINIDDLEDDLGVEIAVKPTDLAPRGSEPMAVINNSFGFGGHDVAVVFTAA